MIDSSYETREPPFTGTLFPDLFLARARRTPEAVAVVETWTGRRFTYGELEIRSRSLAHHLGERSAGAEARVGIHLEPSLERVTAVVAVLRAGGAYVPLDPRHPRERLRLLARDAGLAAVVSHGDGALFDGHEIVALDGTVRDGGVPLRGPVSPSSAAYVLYTSGSTGRPKGVVVEHGALAWLVRTARRSYDLTPRDRVLQLASLDFDLSVLETFPALACGAAVLLHGAGRQASVESFFTECREAEVTVVFPATSLWHEMAAEVAGGLGLPPSLRVLAFGTEAAAPEHVRSWLRAAGGGPRLLNGYGATETTVDATLYEVPRGGFEGERVPIGRPVAGAGVRVVDAGLARVEDGEDGELAVSGPGLARGYLGRPGLTGRVFVPDPEARVPGERLYRTGDRGRRLGDGNLEILGRVDHQVKVRGHRVEPEEVERVLGLHPAVHRSAVVLRREPAGSSNGGRALPSRLVAYYTLTRGATPPAGGELRDHLKRQLPAYMVPSAFVALDALPLLTSGKVDRRSLARRPVRETAGEAPGNASRGRPFEAELARIWSEVLRIERPGVHDDFFELGGDSILNLRIASRAREAGIALQPADVFEHPTIAELAALHVHAAPAERTGGERPRGAVRLTPIQHWFFEIAPAEPWHFNQAQLLEVRGRDRPVSPALLRRAVGVLVEHHDGLRLRFTRRDGAWHQRYAGGEAEVPFVHVDLRALPPAHRGAALTGVASALQASLDLSRGPLLRAAFFDLGDGARFFIAIHHLAVDTVSWHVLLADLDRLVRLEPLAPRSTSYQEWAERLARHALSGAARGELGYWLALPPEVPALPRDHGGGVGVQAEALRVSTVLGAGRTGELLHRVPAVYRTRIHEVLVTALARTLARWTGEREVLVELETHGREDIFPELDLTRTVGWFTAAYPLHLALPHSTRVGDGLVAVKEQMRAVPRNGFGFFLLRYLGDEDIRERLRSLPRPEVSFNYFGQLDGWRSEHFAPAPEDTGPRHSPRGRRLSLLEVECAVVDGRLEITWCSSRDVHSRATLESLTRAYVEELEELIVHCLSSTAGGPTPSKFPLAGLDAAQLRACPGEERDVEDIYPLTPVQEGLLFHTLYAPDSQVYFEQYDWLLEAPGGLDTAAFRGAWERLVERHAILRTAFAWRDLPHPVQIVRRRVVLPWRELAADEGEMARLAEDDRRQGFDPGRPPLMRCCLVRLESGAYRFLWSVHHLLLDGWSAGLLLDELCELYAARRHGRPDEPAPERPFRDYLAWLETREAGAAERFWRRELAGFATPTPLPLSAASTDAPGRATAYHLHGEAERHVTPAETARLQAFARRHRLTPGTLFAAAWALVLARTSGRRDVVFGTTLAGRPADLPGAESMVGLLITTVPVRVRPEDRSLLLPWLTRLRDQALELQRHGHVSLADVRAWSAVPPGRELFESLLGFHNYPGEDGLRERRGELSWSDLRYFSQTNYPLLVEGTLAGDRLLLRASYDRARFRRAAVARVLAWFHNLLRAFAGGAGKHLGQLSLLSAAEEHQLLREWQALPAGGGPAVCVHQLVAARAATAPEAPASLLRAPDGEVLVLAYGELERRAERLARALRRLGVGPEHRVGVVMERSFEMMVALLGVWKAGAAFVLVDPGDPVERRTFLLEDAGVTAVLDDGGLEERPATATRQAAARGPAVTPDHAAYVVYTSGSTGRPKGVVVSHRSLVTFLSWAQSLYHLDRGDRMLVRIPVSFDPALSEIFLPLVTGAAQVLAARADERDPRRLVELIDELEVSALIMVPSLVRMLHAGLEKASCPSVRRAICGGEALLREDVEAFAESFPRATLWNVYGPAEATVGVTSWRSVAGERPAIGRPGHGLRTHVVDPRGRALPAGVPGELWLGGAQLARGYLGRPRLTAERFVPDPFARRPGERLYRSGDLARYRDGGDLDFVGRVDRQVKVRGVRVEVGEIEAALAEHPAVRRVAVIAREGVAGDRRLIACVATEPAAGEPEDELRAHLARLLPEALRPSAFAFFDDLPELTASAKVDRRALVRRLEERDVRELAEGGEDAAGGSHDPVEDALLEIWRDLLGLERPISVHDNLFSLGAHSLIATRAVSRIRQRFGVELPLRRIFEAPTVARLAEGLDGGDGGVPAEHRGDDQDGATDLESTHVEEWKTLYEALYSALPAGSTDGWRSSYTGRLIPAGEMREWISATVGRILELEPRRVLELGCGTGLLLLEIAPRVERYLGTDLSPPAVANLAAEATRRALDHVDLRCQPADDLAGVDRATYDTVVLNSVAQYFPSIEYLLRVLQGAVEVTATGGKIFVGDVRNLALHADFCASVELYRAAPGDTVDELRERIERRRRRDKELLVDPAFFLELEGELERVSDVRIRPKDGSVRNEMTLYRYDVVLELDGPQRHRRRAPRRPWSAYANDPLRLSRRVTRGDETQDGETQGDEVPVPPPLVPGPRPPELPLSFAQQRLWIVEEMVPGTAAFNMSEAWSLRGDLDADALADAWSALARRHETLRTTFPARDGRPRQEIAGPAPVPLPRVDLRRLEGGARRREVRRLADAESRRPLDPVRGPLLRLRLLVLGEGRHVFLRTLHHIVGDGWSESVLARDLDVLYRAARRLRRGERGRSGPGEAVSLPELPVQYADFTLWQRGWLRGRALAHHLDYWRRELAGLEPLELATDQPRPAARSWRGRMLPARLPEDLTTALRELATGHQASLFMVLLAGFMVFLERVSGQRDFAVGSPIAQRGRAEIEDLVGFFVNTLVLRVPSRGEEPRFLDFLAAVRERTLTAYAHQDLPFERLVEELRPRREIERQPLYQVVFALQDTPAEPRLADVEVEILPLTEGPLANDMEWHLWESDGALDGYVIFDPALFDATRVERLVSDFASLLGELAADPARPVLEHVPLPRVERRQLEAGDGPETRVEEMPPAETEAAVIAILREFLEVPSLGAGDDFFELGGHSLLGARVVARIRKVFEVDLSLRSLFEHPTAGGLATEIDRRRREHGRDDGPPPIARERRGEGPLSFAQERLWFLDQSLPERAAYNLPAAVWIRGALDVAALAAALDEIVRRHAVLRTSFPRVAGSPRQRVAAAARRVLPVADLGALPAGLRRREARRLADEEALRPFDLERGPLLRTRLVLLGGDLRLFLHTVHHAVADGTSQALFYRELALLYDSAATGHPSPLAEPPVQYLDFTLWQRRHLAAVLDSQLAFWRRRLTPPPPILRLPADRPRDGAPRRGAIHLERLPGSATEVLRGLGRESGASLFMTSLAAFLALLHRFTGERDLAVGTTSDHRQRPELEGLIGFFINTLVLRNELPARAGFREVLRAVRGTTLDAFDHQDVPFEKLVSELLPRSERGGSPFFQVMFQLHDETVLAPELAGLATAPAESALLPAKLELVVNVFPAGDGLSTQWIYPPELFDATTLRRLAGAYRRLIEGLADGERRLEELPLLSAAETHQAAREWNTIPAPAPPAGSLPELFRERAEATPDTVALVDGTACLTYGELRRRADRLARHLRARGTGRGHRVAVSLEPSLDLVSAILGVLMAGAAYVPLDPRWPAARRADLLAETSAGLLVTRDPSPARSIEVVHPRPDPAPGDPPADLAVTAADPAYVIFTSGSTGRPKGVEVRHGNVLRLLAAARGFGFSADDRWTLFHSSAFDFSVWELWGALAHGGRLVIVPYRTRRAADDFYELLERERVTVLNQTPSAFRLVREVAVRRGPLPSLDRVIFGGEALDTATVGSWVGRFDDHRPALYNLYGITETTVHVTLHRVRGSETMPAIGRSLPGWRAHLLDGELRPVPSGVTGEICVGGGGVAAGYLGRPAWTAERFVPDPWASRPGERLYRSGDLARARADGELLYLGRRDHQVKVRGFRVEPGEVEAHLLRHPAVREAVVLAGGQRLAAFVTLHREVSAGELRRFLGERLPEPLVPATVTRLEAFPLTANGKLDRAELGRHNPPVTEPETSGGMPETVSAPPRDRLERFLAKIWSEILETGGVGRDHDFFELGGDSIRGAVLINRLQDELDEIVHVVTIFDHSTVADLAAYLRREHAGALARRSLAEEDLRDDGPSASPANAPLDAERRARFAAEIAAPWPVAVRDKNPPAIFVLAPPRSGTTLLRVMLAGHSKLFAPPELELLSFRTLGERREVLSGRDRFWREGTLRALMALHGLSVSGARDLLASYEVRDAPSRELYRDLQAAATPRTLVDKTPSYAFAPAILQRAEAWFREPLYLYLARHPAATVRSFEEAKLDQILRGPSGRPPAGYSRRELAELYTLTSHRNILDFLDGIPRDRWLRISFEDLVRSPEPVLMGVCDFLGLAWEPALLRPYDDLAARLADGVHPQSRTLGDVKLGTYQRVEASVGLRHQEVRADTLSAPIRRLVAELGYAETRDAEPGDAELVIRRDTGVSIPVRRRRPSPLPLSFPQQRLWFLQWLDPASAAYNMPAVYELSGDLDLDALRRAWRELVRRHETLRTTFPNGGGEPEQIVVPAGEAGELPLVDLTGLTTADRNGEARRVLDREAFRVFDLTRDRPLRAALLRPGEKDHLLFRNLHHVAGDGWSLGVLHREIAALYAGESPPELPIQYADFALWQRDRFAAGALDEALVYWRRRLAGLTPLDLPTDRLRPAVLGTAGAAHSFVIPATVADPLQRLAESRDASLYMALLAAYAALLGRLAGTNDVTVGSPIANRTRREVEGLIGFFVNTLVLRVDLAAGPGYRELLGHVRERALEAYAHQDLPFEKLVDELSPQRDAGRAPLVHATLALQNHGLEPFVLPGLDVREREVEARAARFDLELFVARVDGALHASLVYNTELFDATTCARLARSFTDLLRDIARDDGRALHDLLPATPSERHQLLFEWSDSAARPDAARPDAARPDAARPDVPLLLHQIFEARAAEAPGALVTAGGGSLSFGELDRRADRLATTLRGLGVGPECCVGIFLERSLEMLVALLGILKAGGAFVPLDPEHPAERLRFLLRDSGVRWLLTREGLARRLALDSLGLEGRPTTVPGTGETVAIVLGTPALPARIRPRADHAAYVIYTSGSTGRPKGVVVTHRAITAYLRAWTAAGLTGEHDRILHKAPLGFDVSLREIFSALATGAGLVLARPGGQRDPGYLAERIARERVTAASFAPSVLALLLDEPGVSGCRSLRRVFCGGETLPAGLARRVLEHLPGAELYNCYGPTETAVTVTVERCRAGAARPAIGRAAGGVSLYLLGNDPRLLPAGAVGEICLGGEQLARGYHGRPALTAERFVPHPSTAALGERLYRTGDLGRFLPDGRVDFLGRLDDQIQVRGVRVEPGEIEHHLRRHPRVRGAVVALAGEDGSLAAWVAAPGEPELGEELRAGLRGSLPDAMVPRFVVVLDALPLLPSGKVDRAALPEPSRAGRSAGAAPTVAPRTPAEKILAEIWRRWLEVDEVGIDDDFFSLGGDSILSIRVVAELNRGTDRHGLRLRAMDLFEHQTVAELARAAARDQPRDPAAPELTSAGAEIPLTPVQLDFFGRELPEPWHFNQAALLRTRPLDPATLERAVSELVDRHEALRLRFYRQDTGWRQSLAPPGETLPVPRVDLSRLSRGRRALHSVFDDLHRRLDLEHGPLLRVAHVVLRPRQVEPPASDRRRSHRLLITIHHLAVDRVSWAVLLEDLERACRGLEELPRTTPFPEWARRLTAWAGSVTPRRELPFWREVARRGESIRLPVDESAGENNRRSAARLELTLDPRETRRLLDLEARPLEVLILALARVLEEWTGRPELYVELEGHGREEISDGVDLSRTVGWFTSLFPFFVNFADVADGARLATVRDALAAVPRRGLGYGVLRHLDGEAGTELAGYPRPEVLLNYLGRLEPLPSGSESLFAYDDQPRGARSTRSGWRSHLLEIIVLISDGKLWTGWIYSRNLHRPATVERLAARFLEELRNMLE